MRYLSHSQAIKFVTEAAGLTREAFDGAIRPRLLERRYSERLVRFSRVAIEHALEDPTFVEREGSDMLFKRKTLKDALEEVWTLEWSLQKGAKTQRALLNVIIAERGETAAKKIDYTWLETWVLELRKRKLKAATIARRVTAVTKALKHAKAKGWIGDVPDRPKISIMNGRERFYTRDEAATLLSTARDRIGACAAIMPHVMAFLDDTGCRLSELMRLRGQDLTDDGVLFLDRKGGDSIKVPLTGRARTAANALLASKWWRHWTAKVHDSDKEVRDTALKNLKDRLTREFRAIRDAAEIPDATLHIYRHSCASRLVQGGMEIVKVQQWLGHADIKTTMIYAHLAPSSLKSGVRLLEEPREDNVVDLDSLRISRD